MKVPNLHFLKEMTAVHVSEFYGANYYTRSDYLITDGTKIVGYLTRTNITDLSLMY